MSSLKSRKFTLPNVPQMICIHLLGEKHTHKHRIAVGICIMIAGIAIAKLSVLAPWAIIHFSGDLVGYTMHGLGSIPIVDHLTKKQP